MTHPYLSQRSHCRLNLIVILNNQISTNNKRFSSNRTALKFTAPARSCPRYIGAAAVSFVFEKYLRPYPYGGATFPQPPSVSVIEFLSGGGKFFGDLSMENLESNSAAEQTENRDDTNVSREDFGALQHGCEHYRRRCKLRAPCCDQIFTCRHCHNEATSILSNPDDRHELVRPDVKQVVCAICNTEQQVSNLCSNCGVKFGEYFCNICKFYDDDITKEQFHCNDCGICRVGGRENFFHCPKCGSCYSVGLRNNHRCVENSMKSHCPICYEFLFDSTMQTTIMKCGHTIHVECYEEMFNQNQYRCPICSKSVLNMSSTWERLDQEIAATAMPEEYRYEVEILCNDCNSTSKALFHIFGHKCQHCNSYNTRVITSREN